jgi:GntR family transcriptional regulator
MTTSNGKERADASQPAYQALAAELRAAIVSGEFPPNRRLPTEAELAESHGVSRQTVRQAFAQLVSESLVYRIRGRGTFATSFTRSGAFLRSNGSVDELLAVSIDTELEVVTPFGSRANIEAAGRLQLETDEVMEISFRRLHDGEPLAFTTVVVPPWVGRLISPGKDLRSVGARSTLSIIGLIERAEAVPPIAGAQQSITAVAATPELAEQTDRQPGDPLLRVDRLYYTRDGARIELAITHFNPVRYAYRLELRRA